MNLDSERVTASVDFYDKPLLFSLRDDVSQIAEPDRWDCAIAETEKRLRGLGGWWAMTVGCGVWRIQSAFEMLGGIRGLINWAKASETNLSAF